MSFNTHCYIDTVYRFAISELCQFGSNKDKSKFVYCPNKECKDLNVKLFTPYYLYRHIEECHPEEKKHQRTILM